MSRGEGFTHYRVPRNRILIAWANGNVGVSSGAADRSDDRLDDRPTIVRMSIESGCYDWRGRRRRAP